MEAFFSNKLLKMVREVTRPDSAAHLRSICIAVASKFEAAEAADELSDQAADCMEIIVLASRGMLALLSPVPHHCGSSQSDVNFLFPADTKQRRDSIVKKNQKFGNRLHTELTRQEQWGVLLHSYRSVVGAEEACSGEVADLTSRARDIDKLLAKATDDNDTALLAEGHEKLASFVGEYCQKLPTWQKIFGKVVRMRLTASWLRDWIFWFSASSRNPSASKTWTCFSRCGMSRN
jgi:hypothetical protein